MRFLQKKILLVGIFIFFGLLTPAVSYAVDYCAGKTASGGRENGICFYADHPEDKPPYDLTGGDCGLGTQCATLPNCTVMSQTLLNDPAYHGIKDDANSCPPVFSTYKCCAPDVQTTPVPPIPCNLSSSGTCDSVSTGIGTIQVDPATIVGDLFGIILGVSGGIAIILIMISGYQIMFSQGDPEKLKAARERLTSAIIGLLFIIFSVVILRVIGVDILHIPGLNP